MELKIDFSSKKTIAGIIALICVIAIIAYLPPLIISANPDTCTVNGICQHEQRLNLLIDLVPVFILAGIVLGAVIFFFMSAKLDNKQKDIQKATETLVQFLNRDEKTVVRKILENNGRVFQSEISRIEGIGKLKSHRILQRLSDRKVIEIEKHGKTNIIKLAKNIQEFLILRK
ncbi:MAG: super-infection exclusion protein B [Candidatus ainarchaeum sp.]|nr:super-infection exclusion protein B [Candidatus ainarchaeum sp.]